jgi:hypothetical protein
MPHNMHYVKFLEVFTKSKTAAFVKPKITPRVIPRFSPRSGRAITYLSGLYFAHAAHKI